ncbi:MAG: 4'-phosphopantetheinyl transferase superfamily protein [Clostridiales Family XIII bacterium]|jgi:phosphopantetheinyl transferase|nr:4'-phosphopantetheinyl transferase superfamily protein [Clostridiales Family XIII bacterium]
MRSYFLRENPDAAKAERDARFRAFFSESLQDYTGRAFEGYSFRYGAHGKPYFADAALAGVFFSISDTAGCRVVCFSEREVGVDAENVRARARLPEERMVKLARRWFAPEEAEYVAGGCLSGRRRPVGRSPDGAAFAAGAPANGASLAERFFWVWTRKEAFVKWTGDGIWSGMQGFSVLGDGRITSGRFGDDIQWAVCEAAS